jgi:hypothetical protein
LLNTGNCDIDATDEDRLTPLHESIIQRHEVTATLLVRTINVLSPRFSSVSYSILMHEKMVYIRILKVSF